MLSDKNLTIMKNFKKSFGTISKVLSWLIFVILILLFFIVTSPRLPTHKYLSAFIVTSGSMEPVIKTGSVALVQQVNYREVKQGDIVVFTSPTDSNEKILHRINQVINDNGNIYFVTKGDNNNTVDSWQVPASLVQDKYITSVPYIGYPAAFIKKPVGFALVVGIPVLVLIFLEIRQIQQGIEEEVDRRTKRILRKHNSTKKPHNLTNIIIFAFLANIMAMGACGYVRSVFTATAAVSGITLSVGDFVTPPPSPKPGPGSVIINEVMWMGSKANPYDEWIELRNMTDSTVDLSGWQITYLSGTGNVEKLMLTIPNGESIDKDGYYLITRLTKTESAINVDPNLVDSHVTLRNGDLQIKLYKGDWTDSGNLIDTADDAHGTPLAGSTTENLRQSMERNDTPGDGTLASSWHTCTNEHCNDTTYWKVEGDNYGTPGGPNLSAGDPTETNLNFYLSSDKHSVGFEVSGPGLSLFDTLDYEVTYDSDQTEQGITGTKAIAGADKIEENNLILGSCSSGGTCIYNTGVKNIHLKVTLHKTGENNTSDKVLEQEINL